MGVWQNKCRTMMMAGLAVFLTTFPATGIAEGAAGAKALPLPTEGAIDLSRYAGLWYEVARTPNRHQDNTPTRDGKLFGACVSTTAEYTLAEPKVVAVRNNCIRKAADGSTVDDPITGFATVVEGAENRKLKLAFGSSGFVRFLQRAISGGGFGYWIACIGRPETGPYDYAVVTGPDRDFIFLLGRTPTLEPARAAEAQNCMEKVGLPIDKLVPNQS